MALHNILGSNVNDFSFELSEDDRVMIVRTGLTRQSGEDPECPGDETCFTFMGCPEERVYGEDPPGWVPGFDQFGDPIAVTDADGFDCDEQGDDDSVNGDDSVVSWDESVDGLSDDDSIDGSNDCPSIEVRRGNDASQTFFEEHRIHPRSVEIAERNGKNVISPATRAENLFKARVLILKHFAPRHEEIKVGGIFHTDQENGLPKEKVW
jgi:hypothetical protein